MENFLTLVCKGEVWFFFFFSINNLVRWSVKGSYMNTVKFYLLFSVITNNDLSTYYIFSYY